MKILYIHARSKQKIDIILKNFKTNKKIGIATTIQFLNQLRDLKLEKNFIIAGQVLGCNVSSCLKIKDKVDAFLYIGSGKFHPVEIALQTKKPVYTANPLTNEISEISKKEIEEREKQIKVAKLKFFHANRVGILVSTKSGQYNLKKAIELKNKIKKESHIFIFNTLNQNEFENFPQIDLWINTACPRIEGKNIINYQEISL